MPADNKTASPPNSGDVAGDENAVDNAKTDIEKAVADYVESNIEEVEHDLELFKDEPIKKLFAGIG